MRRFLIVDDNIALAENLAEIIADADVGEAVLAESGARALVLLADTRFDVLVSDVRMAGMSGVELLQRVRLVDPGLPVILMTAYTTDEELLSAEPAGILSVLHKPVPIGRLLELLVHARRDGIVALAGPHTELRDGLAETMRSNGFAPVAVGSRAETASLGGPPFVVVVDIRTLSDLDGDALLDVFTDSQGLPILAVVTERQRSRTPRERDVFTSWSAEEGLMTDLEGLCAARGHEQSTQPWRSPVSGTGSMSAGQKKSAHCS
jgi:CheY-like chemotaxis protein